MQKNTIGSKNDFYYYRCKSKIIYLKRASTKNS
jgi:hypothetical protein